MSLHGQLQGLFYLKNGVFWVVKQCGSPEDTILHSHRRENLKSYTLLLNCGCENMKPAMMKTAQQPCKLRM
jgi:hypothetical protein